MDSQTVISDIPRLNIGEGKSRIQLMTRDLTTPAFGVFFPKTRQGLWLLTDQDTCLGDSGFDLEENDNRTYTSLTLLAPGMREDLRYYGMQLKTPSEDKGASFKAGDKVTLRCWICEFDCADIPALFGRYVGFRKWLSPELALKHELPLSAAWDILEEKYNRDNWDGTHGYYRVGVGEGICNNWQLGWIGGGMVTYSMLADGIDLSKERALLNLAFMFIKSAAPSGLLYGVSDGEHFYGDAFFEPDPHNMHLIRKNSDVLYFAMKQFSLLEARGEEVPPEWLQSARNIADAFVRLWERYGQFGQFIDVVAGDIVVGGSTSASIAPAGLALASKYFDDSKYLDVAVKSAELYYTRDIHAGATGGASGEILQCPDSESAFGLLESYVVLYELTGDRAWIAKAEDAANLCSTWCVSYDYKFPLAACLAGWTCRHRQRVGKRAEQAFGAWDMHSVGRFAFQALPGHRKHFLS